MTIKLLVAKEKTNSFRPKAWEYTTSPFPAFRGESHRYSAFQAVSPKLVPNFEDNTDSQNSKIITNEKDVKVIVPCSAEENQKILFITMKSDFRGDFSRIETVGNVEIVSQKQGEKHCVATAHLVVILKDESSFVFCEFGRRCSTGLIEVFGWDGIKSMTTEEFNAWQSL